MKTLLCTLGGWLIAAALWLPCGSAWAAPTVEDEETTPPTEETTPPDADEETTPPDAEGETPPETEEPDHSVAPGDYAIGLVYGNRLVLDVNEASMADGANLQTWSSNDTPGQRFTIRIDEDGYATILSKLSGKALDVYDGKAVSGANVQLFTPNNTAAQRWRIVYAGDDSYYFESALNPNLVLDVFQANSQPGANLEIYARNATNAQRFRLYPTKVDVAPGADIADGVYRLQSGINSALVADVAGANIDNGARVQGYTTNGTLSQYWYVHQVKPGFYSLRALHSGKELNVDAGSIVPGAVAHQWGTGSPSSSTFAFYPNDDGLYQIVCQANGYAIALDGGRELAGTSIVSNPMTDAKSQQWALSPVESLLGNGGLYRIDSMIGSHRPLDVCEGSTRPGTNVHEWGWNGTLAQRWLIRPVADKTNVYTIEALSSGMLLTRSGSNAVVQPKNGGNAQQWLAEPSPQGGLRFVCVDDPTLSLDVTGAQDADGINVGVYRSNGTIAQAFSLRSVTPFGSGTFTIGFAGTGRSVDVAQASLNNGANIQAYDANDTSAQKWKITDIGGGRHTITNARSGNAIDVANGQFTQGANIIQWAQNGGANQQWRITYEGGGNFMIRSSYGNLALCAASGAGYNGANVMLAAPSATQGQLVTFTPTSYQFTYEDLYGIIDAAHAGWGVETFGGNFGLSADNYYALSDAINRFRDQGYRVGIAVVDLDTGKGFSAGLDEVIYSACSIKASYVTAICRFDPWNAAGWKSTIDPTVLYSNNETYYALRNAFGSWPLERLMAQAHVTTVPANTNYVWYRPRDLLKLWVAIGDFLYSNEMNAEYCRYIFNSLHYSYIHDVLNGNGTVTYSKPGWYPNVGTYGAFDDGGIVDRGGQRYAVAILSTAYERFDLTNPLVGAIDRAAWELH